MTKRLPQFFPARLSQAVPGNMRYAADVIHGAPYNCLLGAPIALDADGILALQSIATAGETIVFAPTYSRAAMGRFGRNVTVVASGAATSAVTIYGADYLGQLMSELFALNGTTPVPGKKAFARIDRAAYGATAATTINVGWGNVLGLQYKVQAMMLELKNDAVAANAGAIVAGLANATPSTNVTADVRGTYAPATVLPDGVNTFELVLKLDDTNLHGNAQA